MKRKDKVNMRTAKVKSQEKEIERCTSMTEGSLKEDEENQGGAEVKIVTIKVTSAGDHSETNNEKVGDGVENEKETSKESVENNYEINETSRNRKNVRFDKGVIFISNSEEIYSEKRHKGIHEDIYELRYRDRLKEDEAKKPLSLSVCNSLKVNDNDVNEAQRSRIARKENEEYESLCETCRESKLDSHLWIEEYHSEEYVSRHVCETDEGGSEVASTISDKAGELRNYENQFSEEIKATVRTQVDSNRDENSGVETAEQKIEAYHSGRRPSKTVPELSKILELCKSNPDELLCVTVCVRDPRRIEIKRRQVQRKYFSCRRSRGYGRVSNVLLTSSLGKMPIIPEED